MTLPYERYRAMQNARNFLRDLLDPKKTPRVPKEVRRRAYSCLKHFPGEFDLERIQEIAKDLLGDPKEG